MAVYFEPQGKSWLDYVAPIAQQALGGLVQGMFERDSNARNLKMEERKAAEASARKQQEEAIRQQRAQEILGNLNLTDREKAGYSLGLFSPEMAPFIDKISQQFNPHKTLVQQDLGDRTKTMGFDPASGEYLNAVYEQLGINPTRQYEQDASTKREGMSQGGYGAPSKASADPRTKYIVDGYNKDIAATSAPAPAAETPLGQGLTTPTVPEPTPVQNQELTIEEMETQAAELLKRAKDKRRLEPQKMTKEQYDNLLSIFGKEALDKKAITDGMLLPWD
ncbi:hypothetical protein FACS1894187_06230 [Synergistales bacterium]|nr:hypothetical protein FACS1894187_06230 [Synergistales bacterium]